MNDLPKLFVATETYLSTTGRRIVRINRKTEGVLLKCLSRHDYYAGADWDGRWKAGRKCFGHFFWKWSMTFRRRRDWLKIWKTTIAHVIREKVHRKVHNCHYGEATVQHAWIGWFRFDWKLENRIPVVTWIGGSHKKIDFLRLWVNVSRWAWYMKKRVIYRGKPIFWNWLINYWSKCLLWRYEKRLGQKSTIKSAVPVNTGTVNGNCNFLLGQGWMQF